MELLFESRLEIKQTAGKLFFFQAAPQVDPQPVFLGDTLVDGSGGSIYGSVIHDGGVYRMWYQAWPRDWSGKDVALVAYAESNDGISWRKPILNLVEYAGDGQKNNLVNLGVHCPSVVIDPLAPPSHRYRATGCSGKHYSGGHPGAGDYGYYTLHSPDGLHWSLDQNTPQWPSADVITSVYHPAQQRIITALKFSPRYNKFLRRSIWTAEHRDGQWSSAHAALIPDEFDDICAMREGFATGDYYGMGFLPAGSGTVGFLWQFRHDMPHNVAGNFGATDVSLVYQAQRSDHWFHVPGRPNFLSHHVRPWTQGGIYTAASAIDAGKEQWLYFTGAPQSHCWELDQQWQMQEKRCQQLRDEGMSAIGRARWTKDRLFGFRADPEGYLDLDLGVIDKPSRLFLNFQTDRPGFIQVELLDTPDYGRDHAAALSGDQLDCPVAWQKNREIIHPQPRPCVARLYLDRAKLFAYELRNA